MNTLRIGVVLALLCIPSFAISQQTNCFTYASGRISCDGPQSSTQVVPLGHGQTIITQTPRSQPPVDQGFGPMNRSIAAEERRSYDRNPVAPSEPWDANAVGRLRPSVDDTPWPVPGRNPGDGPGMP